MLQLFWYLLLVKEKLTKRKILKIYHKILQMLILKIFLIQYFHQENIQWINNNYGFKVFHRPQQLNKMF